MARRKIATSQPKRPPGFGETEQAVPMAEQVLPAVTMVLVPDARVRPDALADLANHGYSEAEIFNLVIPKRTLARRRATNDPLTVEETDKAMRLKRIAVQAERVFGEPAKAYRWLRKPKRALNGATPVAFLVSEEGARVVEGMLYRIEHGMFA
jgi:putative toxin-antitoxin system antitoxin component (TIGR02293 family)